MSSSAIFKRLVVGYGLLVTSHPALAVSAGHTETASFADVRDVIDAAVAAHGHGRVLVVFDLDNTTLATLKDFGSEHWFLWQAELIKAGHVTPGAVADTVDDLLVVQGWFTNIGRTRLVEERIAQDVQELKSRGVSFMALTSRNLDVRDATLRELARVGLDFNDAAPGPRGGYGGSYLPYDPATPEASGLTAGDVVQFGLAAPKPVIFERGVMLTQGQHKGSMLKTLLAKTGARFDAIVFVDDRAHHSVGVQSAFADRPEQVSTVRYTHELPRIEMFRASDKSKLVAEWCALRDGLATALGSTTTVALRFWECGLH